MKRNYTICKWNKRVFVLFLIITLIAVWSPMPVSAEKSVYKVNSYGELTKYRGSSTVTIRSNTSAISLTAFDNVKTVQFKVANDNAYYKSIDGVLYNKAGTLLVKCPTERTGSFTIPSTVTKITDYAFDGCHKLTRVTMPSSVKTIGGGLFYNCSKLTSVKLSSNITKIPFETFCKCSNLTSVKLPSKVTAIGENAFYKCSSLTSITLSKNLSDIEYSAFESCVSLTGINLPDSVESIASAVFYDCDNLKKVSYSKNMTYIPSDAFSNCYNLTSITDIDNIESIGYEAFSGCRKLQSITFPKTLSKISSNAFWGCISLGTVTISKNLTTISDTAFNGAASRFQVVSSNKYYSSKGGMLLNKNGTRLKQVPANVTGTVTVPKSVTKINSSAFTFGKMNKIVFQDGITTLDKYLFRNLERLHTIVLPDTLTNFTSQSTPPSYLNSDHITSIQITDTNPSFSSVDGVLYNKNQTTMLFYPIGKKGTLTLPDNFKKLNRQLKQNKLTSIRIAEENSKFTSIDGVLYDSRVEKLCCYPLNKTSFMLPKSIKDISYLNRIRDMVKLNKITVSSKNKKFYAKDGVLFRSSNDTLLYYPPKKAGEYVIPSSAAYIEANAFEHASRLTKLTISKNISRHAHTTYLFDSCDSLKEVVVKQGNLNSINMSFNNCKHLKKITLPSSIMTMNMYDLPKGVTIYGWNNTKAQSIAKKAKCQFVSLGTIPNKVTGIKVKKIIDKYQITWNPSSNVSGYQVYTKYDTIANIKGSQNTTCKIKDIYDYDTIYIRAYTMKGKQKIYGKARAYSVY